MFRSEDVVLSQNPLQSSISNQFQGIVVDIIPSAKGTNMIVVIGIQITSHITDQSLYDMKIYLNTKIWVSFKSTAVRFLKIE